MFDLIFYEDENQLNKIKKNLFDDLSPRVICIKYQKYFLKSIFFFNKVDHSVNKIGFTSLLRFYFQTRFIYCEYANFIPRFFSTILNKNLIACIFGYLAVESFKTDNLFFLKHFPKLVISQKADTYIIFGDSNPTNKILNFLQSFAKIQKRLRNDLPKFDKLKNSNYIVFIGQSWVKERLFHYEEEQTKIIKFLFQKKIDFIYCIHPRENKSSKGDHLVKGFNGLVNYINRRGKPKLVINMHSSLGYELLECGLNVSFLIESDYLKKKYVVNLRELERLIDT